jgi:WD40 repeat protein
VSYSPDGKRIIAGDYPGGVIQVWDAQTGQQLTKIETGYGYRGSAKYFFLSPDWNTVYVSRVKRKATRFERDDKKLIRWEIDGEVRAWDLVTGKLRHTFKHSPARGVYAMALSPDASTFVSFEELSGETARSAKRTASLWDTKTRQCRPLPGDLGSVAVYSPDGKMLAVPAFDKNNHVTARKLFEVATAREKASLPVKVKEAVLVSRHFRRTANCSPARCGHTKPASTG